MPSPARLLMAGALSVAATPSPIITATPSPNTRATAEAAYEWSQVPIGGGGFVTGLVSTRTPDDLGVIYARTDVGGAYRWEDETGRWRQLFNASAMQVDDLGANDYSVASIAVAPSDGDVVYAAAGYDFDPADPGDELSRSGRLLRSVDGGATWTASNQRFFVSGNQRFRVGTERLAVDPLDPRHVVFGSQREGLWRSSDGAETWTQIPVDRLPAGIDGDGVGQQAGVNFTQFADIGGRSRLFAGVAHHGVFASDDAGESWQLVLGLGEGEVPAAPALAGPRLIFSINTPDADAARVVEVDLVSLIASDMAIPGDGTSWQVAVDPTDHQHLVLAGVAMRDGLLWTSRDGGASWTVHDLEITSPEIPWLANVGIDQYMSTGRLMFDPVVADRLWFGEGMAVWRTDDVEADSVVWESATLGIEETVVSAIIAPPNGTAIATVADRQGFRLDVAGAFPQSTLIDPTFGTGASIDYSTGSPEQIAWVGAEAHRGTDPERTARGAVSSDGGTTWISMQGLNRDMFGGEVAVSATDAANVVWLPTAYEGPATLSSDPVGLFTSLDGGASWTQVSVDGDDDTFHRLYSWYTRRALAADRVNGHFYLMSDEARFHVSADGGHTWAPTAHAPPCLTADDCHVYGQVQAMPGVAELVWASVGAGGLYVSADAGRSPWARIETIEEAHTFSFGASVVSGGDLAVYLYGRVAEDPQFGLWRTDDLGASWTLVARYPMDLANQVTAIAGDLTVPGRVYVGFGGNGVVVGDVVH